MKLVISAKSAKRNRFSNYVTNRIFLNSRPSLRLSCGCVVEESRKMKALLKACNFFVEKKKKKRNKLDLLDLLVIGGFGDGWCILDVLFSFFLLKKNWMELISSS